MARPVSREEASSLTRYTQTLLNSHLKSICSLNGIKSSGVKSELQGRLKDLITQCFETKDWDRYRQVEVSFSTVCNSLPNPWPPRTSHPHRSYDIRSGSSYSASPRPYQSTHSGTPSTSNAMAINLTFKKSPFYEPRQIIGHVLALTAVPNHKSSITIKIPAFVVTECQRDESMRIMLFAAKSSHGPQDIAFPSQSDVRVDQTEVKGLNMRGLKNKPGTTRPADITMALLERGAYDKQVEFVYALTNEVYYLAAYICKSTSIEQLVAQIAVGNKITKDSVLREFNSAPQDGDEIMATSQVLSLRCPLSWIRLNLPCRAISCSHNQCFDATSYLQLQQQGPQWLCPICNKSAPFDQLAVDEYVKEIVQHTPSDIEQVTIDPTGKWSTTPPPKPPGSDRKRKAPEIKRDEDDDDDDDLSEIVVSSANPVGRVIATPRQSLAGRPSMSHDGASSSAATTPRAASKRSAPAVIDLTLDSDEDVPVRPNKRQYTGRS